jgi:hypothetical protein
MPTTQHAYEAGQPAWLELWSSGILYRLWEFEDKFA